MENDHLPDTVKRLPRGQAQLAARAKRVLSTSPRFAPWKRALGKDMRLIHRAAKGQPLLRKNLVRLSAALDIAEGLPTALHVNGLTQRTYTEDALKAIQTMLQVVPDATVNWQGLVIKTYLEG